MAVKGQDAERKLGQHGFQCRQQKSFAAAGEKATFLVNSIDRMSHRTMNFPVRNPLEPYINKRRGDFSM
jgi:hypothetical protein